jgi:hypothetical protein
VNEATPFDAEWDPCPSRTRTSIPCGKPRHHVGNCGPAEGQQELYRAYIAQVRARAKGMSRAQIAEAVEYHLITWRVLRNEYNGR